MYSNRYTHYIINIIILITSLSPLGPNHQSCPYLGSTLSGGTVFYSQSYMYSEGGYPDNSTATVSCSEGFGGGGKITCHNGSWSGILPECASEMIMLIY